MNLAIMQPYLFPYIGYFQLIHAVNLFVVYDDVQYRKGGYINRNRILVNNAVQPFTFGVKKDSTFLNINQRVFCQNIANVKCNFLKTLELGYRNASQYNEFMPVLENIISCPEDRISRFIYNSLLLLIDYMGIKTKLMESSTLDYDRNKKGQDKVLELNRHFKSRRYINAIGGQDLYDKEVFASNNIELLFLQPEITPYQQNSVSFIPSLSIVDQLMNVPRQELGRHLSNYKLI